MATQDRPPPRRPQPSANRPPFTSRPAPDGNEDRAPRRDRGQRPEPDTRQAFQPPQVELPKFDFDPTRVKLPQIAIVGFLIGIFFHACVVFAVLDDGSSSGSSNRGTNVGGTTQQEQQVVDEPTVTPTLDPTADRKDCNAIRADPNYRSEAERQWFLANCVR